jgi:hypothetical protein
MSRESGFERVQRLCANTGEMSAGLWSFGVSELTEEESVFDPIPALLGAERMMPAIASGSITKTSIREGAGGSAKDWMMTIASSIIRRSLGEVREGVVRDPLDEMEDRGVYREMMAIIAEAMM